MEKENNKQSGEVSKSEKLSIFEHLDKIKLRGNLRQVYLEKYRGELKTEKEWNKLVK